MIDSRAIIDEKAVIDGSVDIGPFSVIGAGVEIAARTRIGSHTVIEGPTRIGSSNTIHHHAVIGAPPQDLKYNGEPTRLEIGDGNIIREFTTIHRGTPHGGEVTRVGNKCMVMAYAHIAHDCQIGNEVIIANAVNMAGHVTIGDFAIIGGLCAIHQFVTIGRHAFIGGGTAVSQDVIPFGLVAGGRGHLHQINAVGLKRRGFDLTRRNALHKAVRYLLKKDLALSSALKKMRDEFPDQSDVMELVSFIESSERGICIR
ncbi:acyl-ACP--UDP-N-acetylglucosamine O-acyltransferase [bacterium]|nr:acyl-ACP--UDP-N-acetylglucosamine O-acyltransferase [candidate division CSSED10-310 bacterium]